MSSKPSTEGVEAFRKLLRERRMVAREIIKLRTAVDTLANLENKHREQSLALLNMLENMDLSASGNAGWEGRMTWFLDELERQASGI